MTSQKEQIAIDRLRAFEPETEPYYLCYSGGKDSDAIRILAALAGVKHDIVHNHTTVDAPETVRYVRSIPQIQVNYPSISMWKLIVKKKMPPTRIARFCCEELKERGGKGRVKVTGVRWAESKNRAESSGIAKIIGKPKTTQKFAESINADYRITRQGGLILNDDNDTSRRMVEQCYRTTSTLVNPIIDWTDSDVWEFLRHYGCRSNPLYQCGYKRVGCIGCPFGNYASMKREFARYPKYKEIYIRTFSRMISKIKADGGTVNDVWRDGDSVFRWWIGENSLQLRFQDLGMQEI